MNLLLEQFDLLLDAPGSVTRLREMILDLAVRGKLVSQDPSDEPASELLARFAEATKLSEENTRKSQELSSVNVDKPTFKVPPGWEWVRLGDIAEIERGGSPRPIKSYLTTEIDGLNWVKIGDAQKGSKYITSTKEKIRREGLSKTRMVYPGDFLLTNSMSFGRPYISKIEGCIHDGWLRIHPPDSLNKDYLYHLLSSPFVATFFKSAAAGAVVLNLNADKVRGLPIPLPPLAEQQRIVAKVDELMRLCDRLETQQAKRQAARIYLNDSALGAVLATEDADFSHRWQFVLDHFDLLYDDPQNVQKLRQAILQLAVQGKLVPQDPNDEAAEILLVQIEKERDRLHSEGKISKPRRLPAVREEEKLHGLPAGWTWTRFGEMLASIQNGLYKPAKYYDDSGVISLRMYNIQNGAIVFQELRRVVLSADEVERYRLEPGDILVNRVNSRELIGKSALVSQYPEALVYESMNMRVRPVGVTSTYLNLVLQTPNVREYFQRAAGQAIGQASINQGHVENLVVALPPLAEQQRIVARVDELMELCDELEARLSKTQEKARQLLEAALDGGSSMSAAA